MTFTTLLSAPLKKKKKKGTRNCDFFYVVASRVEFKIQPDLKSILCTKITKYTLFVEFRPGYFKKYYYYSLIYLSGDENMKEKHSLIVFIIYFFFHFFFYLAKRKKRMVRLVSYIKKVFCQPFATGFKFSHTYGFIALISLNGFDFFLTFFKVC